MVHYKHHHHQQHNKKKKKKQKRKAVSTQGEHVPFSDNLLYLFAFMVDLECSKLLTRMRPQIFHIKQSKIFF